MSAGQDQPPFPGERRGTLGVGDDGHWQIRFERRLAHSPERVWAALTSPDRQARWIPGVTIDATEGGAVVFDFGDEGGAEGRVLAVEEPRHLEHTWVWPGEPPATVRWELTADGDHTVLVLLHRPLRREPAIHYTAGWHVILDALGGHLDGGAADGPDEAVLVEFYSALAEANRPA
ncbi:SRPBCC family protein [Actinomadura sp. KC345]|uniref:SRPBCC family protein n=1 Tax=Actinomadura sp. KC345 TaxID=2530371 RepID=UPI00104E6B31|nr:SRPBCC family protein [Actinomadura sp. KC345]TDC52056.1 SRPBCC family protein [Actinomadura sp. KC345]